MMMRINLALSISFGHYSILFDNLTCDNFPLLLIISLKYLSIKVLFRSGLSINCPFVHSLKTNLKHNLLKHTVSLKLKDVLHSIVG